MPNSQKQGQKQKGGGHRNPSHSRYTSESRWIHNKTLRIARHERAMAKRHDNGLRNSYIIKFDYVHAVHHGTPVEATETVTA